jgi:hypothetical protein
VAEQQNAIVDWPHRLQAGPMVQRPLLSFLGSAAIGVALHVAHLIFVEV